MPQIVLFILSKRPTISEQFSPRIDPARRKRALSDALQLATSTTVSSESHYDVYRKRTSNLRRWLANLLLCLLLRREDGEPLPATCLDANTMNSLSYNIFEFLWYGSNTSRSPDKFAFVAVYYALRLLPEGLLDGATIYAPNGIMVATRLFLITFSIAVKCFQDEGGEHFFRSTSLLKSNLSASSALNLELAIVEALSSSGKCNIFLHFGEWSRHLQFLLEWTFCTGSIDVANQTVGDHIRQLLEASNNSSSKSKYELFTTNASPPSITKVVSSLLGDLNL